MVRIGWFTTETRRHREKNQLSLFPGELGRNETTGETASSMPSCGADFSVRRTSVRYPASGAKVPRRLKPAGGHDCPPHPSRFVSSLPKPGVPGSMLRGE